MLSSPAVGAGPPVCIGCVTKDSVAISDGLQAAFPHSRRQDIESACIGKLEAQGEKIKGLENLNTQSSESTLTDDGNFRQARNYTDAHTHLSQGEDARAPFRAAAPPLQHGQERNRRGKRRVSAARGDKSIQRAGRLKR